MTSVISGDVVGSPLFIVGCPRSGTTLLQYLLREHPALSLPTGESHFIVPLMRSESAFGDLAHPENVRRVLDAMHKQSAEFLETDLHGMQFDQSQLVSELVADGRCTMRSLIDGLFEKNARGEGKPRWADKTPYYALHITALAEWWPRAQFIHLIRDGRDVALSLFGRRHDFGAYNTFFAARYWQQYVETARVQGRALATGRYHELRYEELLNQPRAELERICGFLGVAFDPAILEHRKPSQGGKTPLLDKPLQRDNAQKWRLKMSHRQVGIFERAAGPTLRDFGYELANPAAAPLPLAARALLRLHNIAADRWHRLRGARPT